MAKILSFAWTVPPLRADRKTVTRRDWKTKFADRWHAGDIVNAYDRHPRYKGKPIAVVEITSIAAEAWGDAPDEDYEAEGFAYLEEHPDLIPKSAREAGLPFTFEDYRSYRIWYADTLLYVVRFKLLEVL
jgi:hypothetical protein